MIKNIMDLYVQLKGGLGNQMFQYAKGLSVLEQSPQYTNLILDCSFYDGQERKIIKNGLTGRNFDLDIFDLKYNRCEDVPPGGHMLEGWFQSIEEFDNVIDEVKENFKFANKFPDNIQNLCEEIKSKENSVSVHIRRGDFWQSEVKDDNLKYNASPNDLFYKNIIKKLLNSSDKIIYIYSDQEKNQTLDSLDIRKYLNQRIFITSPIMSAPELFLNMTCHSVLFQSNSTISTWAGIVSGSICPCPAKNVPYFANIYFENFISIDKYFDI